MPDCSYEKEGCRDMCALSHSPNNHGVCLCQFHIRLGQEICCWVDDDWNPKTEQMGRGCGVTDDLIRVKLRGEQMWLCRMDFRKWLAE